MKRTAPERFWARVDRRGPDECWPWTGGGDRYGYFEKTKNFGSTAHRWAWAFARNFGRLPPADIVIRHCAGCITKCCNPAHLTPGTQAENIADKVLAGTVLTGTKNHQAVLDETKVRAIRADGRRIADIALAYGVSTVTIGKIRTNRAWKHVA